MIPESVLVHAYLPALPDGKILSSPLHLVRCSTVVVVVVVVQLITESKFSVLFDIDLTVAVDCFNKQKKKKKKHFHDSFTRCLEF